MSTSSATYVTSTVSNAKFSDGTTVSGSWTVEYSASGTIVAITNARFTVSGSDGTDVFTNAYVMSYANPSSGGSYEMTFGTETGSGSYSSLYIDWKGESPTTLDAGSQSLYTSVRPTSGATPLRLANTGTVIESAACFAAGTRILTADGPLAVEDIAVGCRLVLQGGSTAPVIWTGSRRVDLTRHPRPERLRPVLVAAHAVAHNVPERDVLLSPDHALHLAGHLIPVKALINGETIRQVDVPGITYHHLELPEHGVILAENLPAESYLESGNRASFSHSSAASGRATLLHAEFAGSRESGSDDFQALREAEGCRPFAERGDIVERVRAHLLWRADIDTVRDPELVITYHDGQAVIVSRSMVPGQLLPDPSDRRRLGVKVAGLTAGGAAIPLDHPALGTGWHDLEADGRWTDGAAVVPAELLAGARDLAVTLVATPRYPAQRRVA